MSGFVFYNSIMQNDIYKLFSVEWKAHWIKYLKSCFPNTDNRDDYVNLTKIKMLNVYWQTNCNANRIKMQISVWKNITEISREIHVDGIISSKLTNHGVIRQMFNKCEWIRIWIYHTKDYRCRDNCYVSCENEWIQHCYAKLILVIIYDDYWENQQTKNENTYTNAELIIYDNYLLQMIAKY